jgi:phospholipid/cholesterol/gamma-HCH transport system permease protein
MKSSSLFDSIFGYVGNSLMQICIMLGDLVLFLLDVIKTLFSTRLKLRKTLVQIEEIGVDSWIIAILTGIFAGAVLALQSYIGFKRYGGQEFVGPVVALSMARELGPVITGLMVTGRAGSAIAAEIGTMRITEQIDALQTLAINPLQYLVIPRMVAGTIIMPFLTMFAMIFGVLGGYFIAVYVLDLNGEQFIHGIKKYLEFSDVRSGLIKAAWFGFVLTWVGCFKGYTASGGARGVGAATTQSVVMGSILLILANYFLTAILF